jgi:putative ABC transport system permease protein
MFGRRNVDEEIESHLAEEMADNIARGMDPETARHAALRTFGNVEAAKERARELDPMYWLDTLWQDVRFACRQLVRNRSISATIIATLTVGIAINVCVFTLLNALLLRPWVRAEPGTFVSVIPRFTGEYRLRRSYYGSVSQPDYTRYRGATSLDSLAAYQMVGLTMSEAASGSVRGGLVSCNIFQTVRPGVPVLGRYFSASECATPRQSPVAVLSETTWRAGFHADPSVVGRIVHLNRVAFTVIGVAPDFTLSLSKAAEADGIVWVPYTMLGSLRPTDDFYGDPQAQWLTLVGRRKSDASLAQVQQQMDLLARQADADVPGRVTSLIVTDGSLARDPEMQTRAPIIFAATLGTTTLLLLLVCVNVTTLLVARAAARQREMSVRLSLGAGRFRLLRQLLTESLVLSALASVIAFFVAQRAPAPLWYSLMSGPPPFELTPDWHVMLYCLGVALASAIIAGLSPAVESLRADVVEHLKGSGGTTTAGRPRVRLRSVLVAAQVALSLVLLIEAGFVMRAQQHVFSHDPGFETKQVLNVTLTSVLTGFVPLASFYEELESRIRSTPGVVQTSYVSMAPWAGRNSAEITEIDGKPMPRTRDFRRDPATRRVSPEYFAVVDLPAIRGRVFTADDASQTAIIPAIISEAMARRYWPRIDPIGRRFTARAQHEVIGVTRDVQSVSFMQDDGPLFYAPLAIDRGHPVYMLVRVAGDTAAAAAVLNSIVRQIDPQMVATIVPLDSTAEQIGARLMSVTMFGAIAGLLALLLALTGVYAVVSFSISQRIPEIGIRLALGARPRDVVVMVLRSGATSVCGGLIVGMALALGVAAAIQATIFGVNPTDPVMFTVIPLLLLLAAVGAMWIPARRASAVDPVASLRSQ